MLSWSLLVISDHWEIHSWVVMILQSTPAAGSDDEVAAGRRQTSSVWHRLSRTTRRLPVTAADKTVQCLTSRRLPVTSTDKTVQSSTTTSTSGDISRQDCSVFDLDADFRSHRPTRPSSLRSRRRKLLGTAVCRDQPRPTSPWTIAVQSQHLSFTVHLNNYTPLRYRNCV